MIKKIVISLLIYFGLISFLKSENILSNNKDKTETVKKVEKKKLPIGLRKKK